MTAANGTKHGVRVCLADADAGGPVGETAPDDGVTIRLRVVVEPPAAWPPAPAASAAVAASGGRIALSSRETVILELLADGLTDEAVSRRLGLSRRTVSYAVSNLMRRVQASNRFQLAWIVSRDLVAARAPAG